jgi:hypothetical protein
MGLHRSKIGDEVRCLSDRRPAGSHRDRYVIARLLPADVAGNLQYQITSPAGGQELVVREDKLLPDSAGDVVLDPAWHMRS